MKKKPTNKTVYTAIANKWKKGGPPARPTPDEIKSIFEPHFKNVSRAVFRNKKRKARVLILGATPELRDLALKCKMITWSIDINPNMMKAMSKLMKHRKKGKIVINNWLTMSRILPKEYFDLIISEQSYNIVPLKKWDKFSKEIKKVIQKDGHIIFKFTTVPKNRRKFNPAIKQFSQDKLKAGDMVFISHFSPDLPIYNSQRGIVDLKKQPPFIDKALKERVINQKQWRNHENIMGKIERSGLKLNVLSNQDTLVHLRKYFKILRIDTVKISTYVNI